MTKYFQRGNLQSNIKIAAYDISYSRWGTSTTDKNKIIFKSKKVPVKFSKSIIVRGIGYRVFLIKNVLKRRKLRSPYFLSKIRPKYTNSYYEFATDFPEDGSSYTPIDDGSFVGNLEDLISYNFLANYDLSAPRYLVVRAGHTTDKTVPIAGTRCAKTSKKDRKLTASNTSKAYLTNVIKYLWQYRTPSVYTGRGVRIKHAKPVRKIGKKSKQKGRAF